MKYLWHLYLCRHYMSPIEDAHSQKEKNDLRYLKSYVKLEVIFQYFFFICKVKSLMFIFDVLSLFVLGFRTGALLGLSIAASEDRSLGESLRDT